MINQIKILGDDLQIPDMVEQRISDTLVRLGASPEGETYRQPRRLTVVLIAAALTVALLTGTAFATGFINSIFLEMRGYEVGGSDSKYETIDALSNRHEDTVTVAIPEDGSVPDMSIPIESDSSFTLVQSYYDGEQLMLGYTKDVLLKPAEFGFGPGSEKFGELMPVEDTVQHTVLALYPEDFLTADEYTQFIKTFEETGSVGVIFYEVYIGDHITLEDGTDIGPHGEVERDSGVYLEFNTPLAEAARNQDELTVVLNIKSGIWYYYQDLTGAYYLREPGNAEQVSFTIPRVSD